VLVIWKLDRLGRNLKHLIEVVKMLSKRGVGFKVLQGAPIDTTTSQGKLMFTIFAGLAEFERVVIRERTMAGLEAARARGQMGGRRNVARLPSFAGLRLIAVNSSNTEQRCLHSRIVINEPLRSSVFRIGR
jgi:DNA invertase Pin-like site-specific DNA recombinase